MYLRTVWKGDPRCNSTGRRCSLWRDVEHLLSFAKDEVSQSREESCLTLELSTQHQLSSSSIRCHFPAKYELLLFQMKGKMFPFLTYFSCAQPSSCRLHSFVPWNSSVIVHCVDASQFHYPLLRWWAFRLFPIAGYILHDTSLPVVQLPHWHQTSMALSSLEASVYSFPSNNMN